MRTRISWSSLSKWIVVGLLPLGTLSASGQQPSRDKQIEELQKQVDAINKKLDELKQSIAVTPAAPLPEGTLSPEWIKTFNWRSIGPASMGGRVISIAAFDADPTTYFIGTASGGLLKTVNNGTTFDHQFDKENTVSIGDVCVAPSDRNVVWIGTGEANPRNSVSYGDGVYKSTDGGKTWKNRGLKKSFQIGRIKIHPKDPNIVYVGALGRLYGPNEERGLFKTTNGGDTWEKVLYVDDKTGVIDVQMNPNDPETLLVAMYERQRDGFDSHRGEPGPAEGYDGYDPIKKWGPGSGLYKTTDGGKSFKKLTKGLPTCNLGRIGVDYYRKDPSTVYALVESEKIGMGTPPKPGSAPGSGYLGLTGQDADVGARITEIVANSPAQKADLKQGDIILAIENKPVLSYNQLLEQLRNRKGGEKITLKISRNREGKDVAVTLGTRPGAAQQSGPFGGGTSKRPYSYMYSGQRENAQDQQGPNSFQYGGVYKSTDGGESWTRVNSLNPRPMYFSQIRVDPTDSNYVYVLGVTLYRSSDGGKTFNSDVNRELHPDQHALWIDPHDGRHMIIGCDGGFYVTYDRMANWEFLNHMAIGQFYHVAVDTRQPYHVYGGLQDNGSWAGPSRTLRSTGPVNEDWILLFGGDGFACQVDPHDPDVVYFEFQDGNIFRRNLRTGEMAYLHPRGSEGPPRINWSAPFLVAVNNLPLIPFLPNLAKQQEIFRFNWNTPMLLSSHNSHIFYCGGNYVFRSVKQGDDLRKISPEITRTKRGSATALAESPRNPDVLYVGTDDGALWVTRDGGVKWTPLTLPSPPKSGGEGKGEGGLPGPRWVSSIEASRFIEGRAYVVFDAHRSDDDEPYVYVTEDFGQTWKSLRANLPTGSSRILREDVENSSLLFLGTEFGVWASINRGASWAKLNNNLPTVAVHDLAIHPTAGEMVAATHGRSLWIVDIAPLRQMNADILKAPAHLFQPNTVIRWRSEPDRATPYGTGVRRFVGQNGSRGAQIYYSLAKKANKITLKVIDYNGKTVQELKAPTDPGLHRVNWNLARASLRPFAGMAPAEGAFFPMGQVVPAGMYRLVLNVDGQEHTQSLRVDPDPTVPTAIITPEPDRDGKE
jgi:photosystem II stability/assembly factor-like uncharacterized protein